MKIAIAGDHAAVTLKGNIIKYVNTLGYTVTNFGTDTENSVDYPDFGHKVAQAVLTKAADLGIVICGSGNGINMAVNKHKGIRSALCWKAELAALARQHNNANILALPARFIDENTAKAVVKSFLESSFEGGRHQRRVEKIDI
jgi:ribose 5-phosphate isomerase B